MTSGEIRKAAASAAAPRTKISPPITSKNICNITLNVSEPSLLAADPDAVVLHPGPMNRDVEIDGAVADGPRSLVRAQVAAGVPVRMAVLYHLGLLQRLVREAMVPVDLAQPLGALRGFLKTGVAYEDTELFPTVTTEYVYITCDGPECLGDAPDYVITGDMPVLVINCLESVNVTHHAAK